jgi:hypothetical protein
MKEDKNIEKLIRESLKVEKTPEDFSDKIMQQILASDKKEEMALSSLMTKHALEKTSPEFTSKVMSQIEGAPSIVTNPVIIGKKAWALIVVLMSAFVYYVIASTGPASAETTVYSEFMQNVGNRFGEAGSSLNFQLPEIITNPVFALSVFALSSMLFLDYMMKKRKLSVV